MTGTPIREARTVGHYVHVGRRQRGLLPSPSGLCMSPGCRDEVGAGGRFCPAHEELLARVRGELADDGAGGAGRERFERVSTRGMKSSQPAAGDGDEGRSQA